LEVVPHLVVDQVSPAKCILREEKSKENTSNENTGMDSAKRSNRIERVSISAFHDCGDRRSKRRVGAISTMNRNLSSAERRGGGSKERKTYVVTKKERKEKEKYLASYASAKS
jgi:DNA integrity scanning protein DisA with diadenylate cyclase activity